MKCQVQVEGFIFATKVLQGPFNSVFPVRVHGAALVNSLSEFNFDRFEQVIEYFFEALGSLTRSACESNARGILYWQLTWLNVRK